MKLLFFKSIAFSIALFFSANAIAQDSSASELNITIRYFLYNDKLPYVLINTKTKVDEKFQPVSNSQLSIYLDSVAPSNLIKNIKTNNKGDAQALIPATLKNIWENNSSHKFYAVAAANKKFSQTTSDVEIIKAKLEVDTSTVDSVKTITAKFWELKNNEWVPVKDVEVKIGVSRLDGILPIGKEANYTTDSTGTVTAEFKRENLPAVNGIITLILNVEDNDKYGNLIVEKKLPWGANMHQDNSDFNKRTLWSTRFKTPIWLLFMAYSIMGAVWGVLIYIIMQIIKIKKLGNKNLIHT